MTLRESYSNFIILCRIKNLSKKSIINYDTFILPFVRFCGDDLDLNDLSQEIIDQYIFSLYETPRASATIATYIRNLKIFSRYLSYKYHANIDFKTILVPRTDKKLVKIYSDSEIIEIFQNMNTSVEWITARNRAMVALMLDSGLRQNEICTLLKCNVDYDHKIIKVHGKGNKERMVPLGKIATHYLKSYLTLCPFQSDYIFVSRRGIAVSCDAVKHMMYRTAKNLPFEFSSHKLRHNFATNYCLDEYKKNGHIDIYRLMCLMGHEDLKTTQRYLHHAMNIIAATSNVSHLDSIFKTVV